MVSKVPNGRSGTGTATSSSTLALPGLFRLLDDTFHADLTKGTATPAVINISIEEHHHHYGPAPIDSNKYEDGAYWRQQQGKRPRQIEEEIDEAGFLEAVRQQLSILNNELDTLRRRLDASIARMEAKERNRPHG